MKKRFCGMAFLLLMPFLLTGCGRIGEKTASISVIYGVMAVLSLLLLIGYCCVKHKRSAWTFIVFCAVTVVNCGYFALSVSTTLTGALWANRIAYLGSVLLPVSMLMLAMEACDIRPKKWLITLLLTVSLLVFLIAASPGVLPIYYKEVTLAHVNGAAVLNKVYGPWHKIYLIYLLAYSAAMIALLIHSAVRKKVESRIHAIFIGVILCINMGVWLLGQLVRIDFEPLFISYIISEIFLLCMLLLGEDRIRGNMPAAREPEEKIPPADESVSEPIRQYEYFAENLASLTRTEHMVYDLYIAGKSSREIMEELNIKENTLKYHNRNIFPNWAYPPARN